MTNLENNLLITLIIENILLIFFLFCWLTRHCQKCQQVKCLERIFNKLCLNCKSKPKKKAEELEIF